MNARLVSVYDSRGHDNTLRVLYDLLASRPEGANISHKEMPSWGGHCAFVDSHPYSAWYLVEAGGVVVGTVYLTRSNEVGVTIDTHFRRQGFGIKAVVALMHAHPRDYYLANIAPGNEASQAMFGKIGVKLIQCTYKFLPENAS